MRKICVLLIMLLALSGFAYGKDTINVLTTTEDLKSIAEAIGGDKVKVDSLARGLQDPHFVDAKPSFMIKAKNADLFIRIGLELEIGYEDLIIDGSRNQKIRIGNPGHLGIGSDLFWLSVSHIRGTVIFFSEEG